MENNKNNSSYTLTKQEIVRALLSSGENILVNIDTTKDGVVVPFHLMRRDQVALEWGYNMAVPIPDMKVDSNGISGTLSFRGVPFHCTIPWHSVYAIRNQSGKGVTYPDDFPASVKKLVSEEVQKTKQEIERHEELRQQPMSEANSVPSQKKKNDFRFKVDSPPAKPKRELPPYLRVVK